MIKFRKELDGIRFLSIILVILYHAKIPYFSDFGYLGVDVFFVISGYLITSILLNEYDLKKKIDLFNFVERRLRRIIPAVIFLILILFIINILFFYNYPKVFELNLEQIIKTIFFISNEMKVDYFAPSRDFKILYHSWSLSIEMQIYLLFSILFIFITKLKKKIQIYFFLLTLLFTGILTQGGANFKTTPPFFENEIFLFNQPYWAGFFSIIPRIFEFSMGVLCAYLTISKNNNKKNLSIDNFFSFFGLFLVILSLFFFKETTQHPSIYTVPLLIGISLMILHCVEDTYLNSLLSWSPITYLGKLSYSAYLIHVPIIFLINFYYYQFNTYYRLAVVLILTFIISYISYNFIEKIFRGKKISSVNFYSIVLFFYIVIFTGVYFVKNNENYISNKNSTKTINFLIDKNNYLKDLTKDKELYGETIEFSSTNYNSEKEKLLIVGNSVSKDFFLMFNLNKELFPNYEFRFFRFHLSNFIENESKKKKRLQYFLESNLFKDSDVIIIASNFRKYGKYSEDIEALQEINKIAKIYKKKLILTSNVPQFESIFSPIEDLTYKYKLKDLDSKFLSKELFKLINKNQYKKNKLLKDFAIKNNIIYLDTINYLCDWKENTCDALDEDQNILHKDSVHLSIKGAKYFGKKIHNTNWFKLN